MKLSRKALENTTCIACNKPFGRHTKNRGTKFSIVALMECMFRIQGTFVANADSEKAKRENSGLNEILNKGITELKIKGA